MFVTDVAEVNQKCMEKDGARKLVLVEFANLENVLAEVADLGPLW
jgi:hypothetical protein